MKPIPAPPRFQFAGEVLAVAFLVLFLAPAAKAATCYAVANANWNVASTWATSSGGAATGCPLAGTYPGAIDTVIIGETATARTVTIPAGFAASAASIAIGSTSTACPTAVNGSKNLTLADATSSLTVSGDVAVCRQANNVTSELSAGAGTVQINGSATLGGTTGTRYTRLAISTGSVTITGNLTPAGAGSQVVFSGAGTLNIGGNFGSGGTYTASTGTVVYNGSGAQAVGTYGYYNLTINKSAGTATTGGNITIGNNLTLTAGTLNIGANTINRGTAGGTLTLASGATLQIASSNYFPANYATETIHANSTVEFNAAANQTIPAKAYGHLLLSNSGNRNLPNTAMTVGGDFSTTGTVAAITNAALTVTGNMNIGDGTSLDPKTFTHNLKGNLVNNGSLDPGNNTTSTFNLNGAAAQTISGVATTFYNLAIANAAGASAGVALVLKNNLTINSGAVFSTGSYSHSIRGSLNNSGTFNADTGTFTFNGSAAQSITGVTAFHNLVMNNAAGLGINNDVTVGNTLTLTSGIITTGVNTLISASETSCGVTRTGGHVNGRLRKNFTLLLLGCDFEIGDSANYAPITLSFASVSTSGNVTASTTGTDHPQPLAPGFTIDQTLSVNRYWTLTRGGSLEITTYGITFNYIGGSPIDNDDTSVVTDYIVQRYDTATGSWSNTLLSSTPTATQASISGVSSFGTASSEFAIGASTVRAFSREREWVYQRELYY